MAFESVVNLDICQFSPGFLAVLTKKAGRPMIGLLPRILQDFFHCDYYGSYYPQFVKQASG